MVKYQTSRTGTGQSGSITPEGHFTRLGFGVVVSGTVTYTVQHTFDGTNWFDHEFVTTRTANDDGNYAFPVAAIRLNVTAGTGTATLTVLAA
jgi:hypothetical protein